MKATSVTPRASRLRMGCGESLRSPGAGALPPGSSLQPKRRNTQTAPTRNNSVGETAATSALML